MRLRGQQVDDQLCREILDRVDMGGRLDRRPAELSGGQQQRVAIARALATRPSIIFADEPTGALASNNAAGVLDLLREAVDEFAQTLVMVNYDPCAATFVDKVIIWRDGKLVDLLAW